MDPTDDHLINASIRDRLTAWHRLAEHPFFNDDCYTSDDPLIDAMIAKLDRAHAEQVTS